MVLEKLLSTVKVCGILRNSQSKVFVKIFSIVPVEKFICVSIGQLKECESSWKLGKCWSSNFLVKAVVISTLQ